MEDIVVTLGKRIRALRLRTGLSQEKFAARAGLDRTYYAGIARTIAPSRLFCEYGKTDAS